MWRSAHCSHSMRVMALGLPAKLVVSASCRIHLASAAMKNNLPDRWTEYSAIGNRIPGTRFIAFKVPLKKLFDNKLTPCQRFSSNNLISEVQKQNEELGLVVDLTCTKRYYAPQELPMNVQYAKIFTAGQQVPNDDVIHEFKSIVKQFLNENADNDKLVGVHCTHGLNRTGYLVCRYMIDILGMVPSEAIEKFNKSRGHCIERKNYIDDLLEGKPRNNTGSGRYVLPNARHQQHISTSNVESIPDFRPPICRQEHLWFPGHSCDNASWGPRLSSPPISQLSGQYIPRPQHSFQQMGGTPPGFPFVNPGPRIPPPGFPHPHMPGPRHIPRMEDHQQQHFRGGPQRYRHQPKRDFSQQYDDRPVNGTLMWDPAPYVTQKYGSNMMNCTDTQSSGPYGHERRGPYSRWARQGGRGFPGQQWQ